MKAIRNALSGIDRYWFGYGSPTTMGVFRIFVGTICLLNMAMVAIDFFEWYGEKGWVPLKIMELDQPPLDRTIPMFGTVLTIPFPVPRLALLNYVADSRITLVFYILVMVAALLTALGLWSRISAILLAVGTVSIHHRDPLILHGGDTVLRLCVLYVALSPCGAACSLDRLIGLARGSIPPEPPKVSLWPQRILSFNVAVLYFTSVWIKWDGNHWHDGTATWYPARLAEFGRFWVPNFFKNMPFVTFTTYATVATEFALGTLVFYRPARKWILLGGLGMHACIEYSMNIPLFAFAVCSTYISFYDGEEVTAWAKRLGARLKGLHATVAMPAGKELTQQGACLLSAADPFDLVRYERGSDPGWTAAGKPGLDGRRIALKRSVGAWIPGLVPGVWARWMDRALKPAKQVAEDQKQPHHAERKL